MESKATINLDWAKYLGDFHPYEIVKLHQMGAVSVDEIIESGRHLSEFGDILKTYLDCVRKVV